jgi:hypothetical protein
MCEAVSRKMLATVKTAKLYDKARTEFERMARQNDCEGMWRYLVKVTTDYPEIDRGMSGQGLKPLAAVKGDMERLYQEHRTASGSR